MTDLHSFYDVKFVYIGWTKMQSRGESSLWLPSDRKPRLSQGTTSKSMRTQLKMETSRAFHKQRTSIEVSFAVR